MKKNLCSAVGLCSVAILCRPTPAAAYDYNTHSRIVEEAVYIMQHPPASSPAPSGVNPQDWNDFLLFVSEAPGLLGRLKTGLPKSLPTAEVNALLQVAPPANDPPTSEGFPFTGRGGNCQFDTHDNLANVGDFRIEDYHYDTARTGPCGVALEHTDAGKPMRKLLGWHAAKVDDNLQDTVMWYRPTNAGFLGAVKHAASKAFEEAVGALLIPFVCAWEFLSGGSCDTDDAEDLATKVDPINYVDSWIPGIGNIYGSDYTGLWHFIDVAAGSGRYNDIRGMLYEDAGRDHPGTIDVGIMAFSDITGLSLKPSEADGDDHYGKYDRVGRNNLTWQSTTIGHLEWSPLDHLAAYGWDGYRADPTNSHSLGWVLHALGDAGEPHHVTGTTSWGHRPYEDFVDFNIGNMLLLDDVENDGGVTAAMADAQHNRILALAFPYFKSLSSAGFSQPVSVGAIESLVTQVAQGTYASIQDQDWPFDDTASVYYVLGGPTKDGSVLRYSGDNAKMMALLEPTVGAVLAFLTYSAAFAQDPGRNPDTACPADSYFDPPSTCVPGVPPIPPVNLDLDGLCPGDGVCGVAGGSGADAGTGAACSTSADCVVGSCIAGVCSTSCLSQPCGKGICQTTGTCCLEDTHSCQSSADCCGNSQCIAGACQGSVL